MVEADFPVSRDRLYDRLKMNGIHPRRYFYPLISDFPMYRGLPSAARANLPVAAAAAEKVLCLPIYPDLSRSDQDRIVSIISET
jgi:dTDP-4-amino-4,6-dideoxygalactose transaminase